MSITVRCPNPDCGIAFHVPDTYAGKTGRCHKCHRNFTIQGDPTATAVTPPPPRPTPARPAVEGGLPHIGRFQVRGKLGSGAFGTVYRAHDPQLEREVALKVPVAAVLDSPKRVERFLREAKAAAALRHPHIVPVYEAGLADGQHYIASAFIEGQPLARAIPEGGMESARAARIVRDLGEALAYAHQLGVVHRDVKPANIMLDGEDRPHLMDFGLAARLESTEKLTHEGAVLGTPSYMAPEQAKGQEGEAKPESDQYSLGVVLYELLTGKTPFEGPPQVVLFNVLNTEPPPPRKLRKDLPRDLETICMKAMAKDPNDRYADCQSLADDLRRWSEGEPIRARRLGFGERFVRLCKRDPKLAGSMLVTVASLALAVGLLFWKVGQLASSLLAQQAASELALEDEQTKAKKARDERDREAFARAQNLADRKDFGAMLPVLHKVAPAQRGWEWHHLRLQGEGTARKLLPGHNGVQGLAFHAGSRLLATVSRDGSVRLFDVATGKLVRTLRLQGVNFWNTRFALSADGTRLATCTIPQPEWYWVDPRVVLSALGQASAPQIGPANAALYLAATRQVPLPPFRTPARPNDVIVWDARTGDQVTKWKTSPGGNAHLAVNASGSTVALAVGDWNQPAELKVHDGKTGEVVHAFAEPVVGLTALVVNPEGDRLVTLAGGTEKPRKATVWESKTGKETYTLDTKDESVSLVAYSPDGKQLATATGGVETAVKKVAVAVYKQVPVTKQRTREDGMIEQYTSYETVTETVEKEVHAEVPGSGVPTLRLHDSADGKELLAVADVGQISAVAFNPDHSRIALCGVDGCANGGEVRLLDTSTGERLLVLKTPAQGNLTLLAFSPDGQHLAAAPIWQDTVTLWSAHPGRLLHGYDGHRGPVCSVSFSPDGGQVASYSTCNQTARVWQVEPGSEGDSTPHLVEVMTVPGTGIPLAFSPDGARLSGGTPSSGGYGAYGGYATYGGYTTGFGSASRSRLGSCYGIPGGCGGGGAFGIAHSGNSCYGAMMVCTPGSSSAGVKVWDRAKATRVEYPKQAGEVLGVTPDGTLIAAVGELSKPGETTEVQVWDVQASKPLWKLKDVHDGAMVQFSPDGSLVAAYWSRMETKQEMITQMRTRTVNGKAESVPVTVCVTRNYQVHQARVWQARTGKQIFVQHDAQGVFAFSPDSNLFVVATRPMRVGMPMPPGAEPVLDGPVPTIPSPRVVVWDTRTGKSLVALEGLLEPACTVRFAPDGKSVLALVPPTPMKKVQETRTVMKKETRTVPVKKTRTVNGKTEEYTENQTQIFDVPSTITVEKVVGSPGLVRVWEARTGRVLVSQAGASSVFAFSPDGTRLATTTAPDSKASSFPQVTPAMPMPAPAMKVPGPSARLPQALSDRHYVSTQEPPIAVPQPVPPQFEDEGPMAPPAPMMHGTPSQAKSQPGITVWDLTSGKEVSTLKGHTSAVTALRYSPEGNYLASADFGDEPGGVSDPCAQGVATILIWDADAGKDLLRFGGHTGAVNCLAWRPDGQLLASASDDGLVKLWQLDAPSLPRSPRVVATLGTPHLRHWYYVDAVAYSPDGQLVASSGDDAEIRVYDTKTGNLAFTLTGNVSRVRGLAWSPDGRQVASSAWDQTIRIFDVTSRAEVRKIQGWGRGLQPGAYWCLAWSPNGQLLAAGREHSNTVDLWNPHTGSRVRSLPAHQGPVTAVAFSPDSRRLVSVAWEGPMKLWDVGNGKEIRSFAGHKGQGRDAVFTPDAKSLLTVASDGVYRVWDVESGKEKQSHPCHGGDVFGMTVSRDGKTMAISLQNSTVQLRNLADGKIVQTLKGHLHGVHKSAFHPDGKQIATAGVDHTVRLWDPATGKELFPQQGHVGQVHHAAVSPDGKTVASCGWDGSVRLWDLEKREQKQVLLPGGPQVYGVAFSPDGKEVASAGDDGVIQLWDLASGKNTAGLRKDGTGGLRAVAYSADGKLLAGAYPHQNMVRVWDRASGQLRHELAGHMGAVVCVAFTPEGDLMSGSHDGTVKVWDMASGKEKQTLLQGQPDWAWVWALAQGTGKCLVVGHQNETFRVWAMPEGKVLHTVGELRQPIRSVTMAPDDSFLVVGDQASTVRLYDPATGFERDVLKLGPARGIVGGLCTSPDGRHVVTANGDGTLNVIEMPAPAKKE